jgi:hypothetical protein
VAAKSSKTTFAKLDRERRLREKRALKQARKDARKENADNPGWSEGESSADDDLSHLDRPLQLPDAQAPAVSD